MSWAIIMTYTLMQTILSAGTKMLRIQKLFAYKLHIFLHETRNIHPWNVIIPFPFWHILLMGDGRPRNPRNGLLEMKHQEKLVNVTLLHET